MGTLSSLLLLASIGEISAPEPTRYELGSAMVLGILAINVLGTITGVIIALIGLRRNPPLEGQFVDYEEHQRHIDHCEKEHGELWRELRKNQTDVAGIAATLELLRLQIFAIDQKLDRAIERNSTPRKS